MASRSTRACPLLNATARIVAGAELPVGITSKVAGMSNAPAPTSRSTCNSDWPCWVTSRRTWSMSCGIDMSVSMTNSSPPLGAAGFSLVPQAARSVAVTAKPVQTRATAPAVHAPRVHTPRVHKEASDFPTCDGVFGGICEKPIF
jgi:hypothetical protein